MTDPSTADDSQAGGLSKLLSRPDAGLLVLNATSLTFAAGLANATHAPVNIPILAGGLSIALFFSILFVYFTIFGSRVTLVSAERANAQVTFDTALPINFSTKDSFPRELLKFLEPLAAVAFVVAAVFILNGEHKPAAFGGFGMALSILSNLTIAGAVLVYLLMPIRRWRAAEGEAVRQADERWPDQDFLPQPVLADPPLPQSERLGALKRGVNAMQSLRINAAFTSIAAFMLAVGLALIDAGGSTIGAGVQQPSEVQATAAAQSDKAAQDRSQGSNFGAGGADTAKPGETKPDGTKPDGTKPDGTAPDGAKPADCKTPPCPVAAPPGPDDVTVTVKLEPPDTPIRMEVDGLGPLKMVAPASIPPVKMEPPSGMKATSVIRLEPATANVALKIDPPSPIQIRGLNGQPGQPGAPGQPWTPPAKGFTRTCDKHILLIFGYDCRYVPAG